MRSLIFPQFPESGEMSENNAVKGKRWCLPCHLIPWRKLTGWTEFYMGIRLIRSNPLSDFAFNPFIYTVHA